MRQGIKVRGSSHHSLAWKCRRQLIPQQCRRPWDAAELKARQGDVGLLPAPRQLDPDPGGGWRCPRWWHSPPLGTGEQTPTRERSQSCAARCTHGVNSGSPAPSRGTAPVTPQDPCQPRSLWHPRPSCPRGDAPRARCSAEAGTLAAHPTRREDKGGTRAVTRRGGHVGGEEVSPSRGPPQPPHAAHPGTGALEADYLPSQLAEAPAFAGRGEIVARSETTSDAPRGPCRTGCRVLPARTVHPRQPCGPLLPANGPFLPAPLPLQV